MQAIINMKDLISYFREAVKARDTMIYDVKHTTVEEYAKMFGLEVPIRPQKETCITDNDVIAEMTIKERHDMLRLEAIASTYGKYIHKNGAFSKARTELTKKLSDPIKTTCEYGKDIIITYYTETVSKSEVDKQFFKMQQKQREAQAKLNGYKHRIDTKVKADQIEKTNRYADEMERYNIAYNEIYAKLQAWKVQETSRIEKLGIIVPDHLKDICSMVSALGKEKKGK